MPRAGPSIRRRHMKRSLLARSTYYPLLSGAVVPVLCALPNDRSFNVRELGVSRMREILCGRGNFRAVGSALFVCNQIFQAASGKCMVDFRE